MLTTTIPTKEGITLRVKFNHRPRVVVRADRAGLVGHAGSRLLAEVAERSGLEAALSCALAPVSKRVRRHDPARVLVDLAVIRQQPELFGQVASTTTAWRVLDSIDEQMPARLAAAVARARATVCDWELRPERVTLDFDATLVEVESEGKELAAPNYKHGLGHHPVLAYLGQTGEALGGTLRPGNAGSNTARDHVGLLDEALAQLPPANQQEDKERGLEVLVRWDSAGASHSFVNAIVSRGLEFSVGPDASEPVRKAILKLPDRSWVAAIAKEMEELEEAEVAEITRLRSLSLSP